MIQAAFIVGTICSFVLGYALGTHLTINQVAKQLGLTKKKEDK